MSSTKTIASNFVTFIFLLIPILSIYYIGSVGLSEIVLILLIIWRLIKGKLYFKVNKPILLIIFFVFIHALSMYVKFSNMTIINYMLIAVFYMLMIMLIVPQINKNSFYKYYKIISIFIVIGLLYHLLLLLSGHTVNPIAIFPSLLGHHAENSDRPMSFFTEPSHLASYLLPLFIISLYKNDFKWSVFIGTAILMSMSMLGISCIFIIMLYYSLTHVQTKYKPLLLGICFLIAIIFTRLTFFQDVVARFSNLSSFETLDGSSTARLVTGFMLLDTMPTKDIIFGIGAGNKYIYFNHINEDFLFYNSLSGIIIEYGALLAIILLFIIFFKITKTFDELTICFLLLVFLTCATSTIFFTMSFFYIFSIILIYEQDQSSRLCLKK